MNGHTLGPWSYCWSATSQVFMVKAAGFGGLVVADTREKENARLIAAAPELLEALKGGLAAFELFMKHANWGASALTADAIRGANEAPGKMRAAIAKAEGREL